MKIWSTMIVCIAFVSALVLPVPALADPDSPKLEPLPDRCVSLYAGYAPEFGVEHGAAIHGYVMGAEVQFVKAFAMEVGYLLQHTLHVDYGAGDVENLELRKHPFHLGIRTLPNVWDRVAVYGTFAFQFSVASHRVVNSRGEELPLGVGRRPYLSLLPGLRLDLQLSKRVFLYAAVQLNFYFLNAEYVVRETGYGNYPDEIVFTPSRLTAILSLGFRVGMY